MGGDNHIELVEETNIETTNLAVNGNFPKQKLIGYY